MTVDPAVIPGFLLLLAELAALAAVGYLVVRVALRQADDRAALAQGLVVGPALWGVVTNFVMYAVPGLASAAVGWGVTLALGAEWAWRAPGCRFSAAAVAKVHLRYDCAGAAATSWRAAWNAGPRTLSGLAVRGVNPVHGRSEIYPQPWLLTRMTGECGVASIEPSGWER